MEVNYCFREIITAAVFFLELFSVFYRGIAGKFLK
jgi:hypothetical protein